MSWWVWVSLRHTGQTVYEGWVPTTLSLDAALAFLEALYTHSPAWGDGFLAIHFGRANE